jgi:hypothetical protein
MSLNEKADVIEEIVQVCKNTAKFWYVDGINDETPQIYMYDGDSEKELALWTGEGAAS